jgi:glutathione synthase/RimK-type ligase-like ATP-grasp enzyme
MTRTEPTVHIALATGELHDPLLAAKAIVADAPLVGELQARGATVQRPNWRDPAVDWSAYDAVMVRTTWDYRDDREGFVDWAAQVEGSTVFHNPADVLRWNTHKSYLLELEERGAPVIPTAWLGRGDGIDLAALLAMRSWRRAILKPAVGAGGVGIRAVDAEDADDLRSAQAHLDYLLRDGDALVQLELARAHTHGEVSVIVIDGEPTHAVRARPAAGADGPARRHATVELEPLTRALADLALWTVESIGTPLLYARVDLLDDDLGVPQVNELEATEANLYLDLNQDAASRLAESLLSRLSA